MIEFAVQANKMKDQPNAKRLGRTNLGNLEQDSVESLVKTELEN